MGVHQSVHGDGVKDVAFSVEDCRGLFKVSYTRSSPGGSGHKVAFSNP